jgi:hypothetical protein
VEMADAQLIMRVKLYSVLLFAQTEPVSIR